MEMLNFPWVCMRCSLDSAPATPPTPNPQPPRGAHVLHSFMFRPAALCWTACCLATTTAWPCTAHSPAAAQDTFTAVQAKGAGYAISQEDELQTVLAVATSSGVVLDPVYSGKALHCLLGSIRAQPEAWRGKRVLFVHTGGLLVSSRGHDECG